MALSSEASESLSVSDSESRARMASPSESHWSSSAVLEGCRVKYHPPEGVQGLNFKWNCWSLGQVGVLPSGEEGQNRAGEMTIGPSSLKVVRLGP